MENSNRVAQDRGVIKSTDSGAQRIYVPPVAGETIRIEAPTSFSKDKDVVDKLAGSKMGDVIYYTIEPGARAVDVSKLSPYKQEELLSCGEYEVVSVDTKTLRVSRDEVGRFTPENLEVLRQTRNAEVPTVMCLTRPLKPELCYVKERWRMATQGQTLKLHTEKRISSTEW